MSKRELKGKQLYSYLVVTLPRLYKLLKKITKAFEKK